MAEESRSQLSILLHVDQEVTRLRELLGDGAIVLPEEMRGAIPYSQTLIHTFPGMPYQARWNTTVTEGVFTVELAFIDGYRLHEWKNPIEWRPAEDVPGTMAWAEKNRYR